MANKRNLAVGTKLMDHKKRSGGRIVELIARVNPQGDTPAYWQVQNMKTDKKTTIREDRLEGNRWSNVTDIA